MRWIGHPLRAEATVVVDGGLTVQEPTPSRWTPSMR